MSGAIPDVLMDGGWEDEPTVERAVDPLNLLDPSEWADIPTCVEVVMVINGGVVSDRAAGIRLVELVDELGYHPKLGVR